MSKGRNWRFHNSLKSETENKWRAKLEGEKNILLATEGISQKIIENQILLTRKFRSIPEKWPAIRIWE